MIKIRDAVANDDPAAVQRSAHTLKGAVGTFGPTAARTLAQKLETLGHDHSLAAAPDVMRQLDLAINELCRALKAVSGTT
jgi:HPt (histidine-containing phosphotransfer) domain-containing protein